jgi:hypothetical protein
MLYVTTSAREPGGASSGVEIVIEWNAVLPTLTLSVSGRQHWYTHVRPDAAGRRGVKGSLIDDESHLCEPSTAVCKRAALDGVVIG